MSAPRTDPHAPRRPVGPAAGHGPIVEPAAFEALFEAQHGFVWAYLARRGGPSLADDLAGEVFVRAFALRHRYDPGQGSARGWLCGIAANVLRTRLRSEARAARAFERAARQRTVEPSVPETALVGDEVRSRLAAVVAALLELPSVDREVLTLYAWEELSYEEIAAATGVAVGTVRSRLSRARARLRELLGDSGEVAGDDHPLEAPDG